MSTEPTTVAGAVTVMSNVKVPLSLAWVLSSLSVTVMVTVAALPVVVGVPQTARAVWQVPEPSASKTSPAGSPLAARIRAPLPPVTGIWNGRMGRPRVNVLSATPPKLGAESVPWELNCKATSMPRNLSTGCCALVPKSQASSRAVPATPSPSTSSSSQVA